MKKIIDGRWKMAVAVGFVWFMVMGTTIASIGLFILPVSETFHGSMKDVGYAAAAFIFAMTIVSPVLGGLVDRFGAHGVMAVGVVLTAVSFLGAASSSSIVGFSWAMAFAGAGTGAATYLPGMAVIASWFADRRGSAMGLGLALASMGSGLVPLGVAWLIDLVGWQDALRWIGGTLLCIVLPVVLVLIRAKPITDREGEELTGDKVPAGLSVAETLRRPVLWMLVSMALLSGFSFGGLYLYIVPYLEHAGYSSTMAAGFFGLANISTMLGSVALGWMADRAGHKTALFIGLSICALSAPLVLLSGLNIAGLIAITLFGLFWGATCSLSPQFVPLILIETAGMRHFGLLLGGIQTIYGLAMAAGPALVGTMHDATSGYRAPFLLCAGCVALTVVIVAATKLPNKASETNHA